MRIFGHQVVFIINVNDYFSLIEVIHTQILECEIKGLLPYGVIRLFSSLYQKLNTAVFRV